MPSWSCCTFASPCPSRSPSSPACGWTPPCMNRRHPSHRASRDVPGAKGRACPPCSNGFTIRLPHGPASPCPGMTRPSAPWKSPRTLPSGIIPVCRRSLSGGSWSGTPWPNFSPKPCCAPAPLRPHRRLSSGSCCAGRWRSLSKRPGPIWASRLGANGQTGPARAPPRCSWVTLAAHRLGSSAGNVPVRRAAWYDKPRPTFSDAIALTRQRLWYHPEGFCTSPQPPYMVEIPAPFLSCLVDTACYAA